MIIELLVSFFCTIIIGAINTISFTISLPLNIAYSISNYTGFFTFLIGNDLVLALIGTITFWFVVRTGFGIVLFIWRLIPFT